ncbi:MAG: N-acetyl-gamma-glutamyl-phosphate reductase [Vallitaleaceae bacterium]|nr:N-acetyl-gamma-glutamyl-phosphate reductase [Vallitaleaceae bacterium]
MYKVYVDGQHGTTGLLVNQRLEKHPEVEIISIPFEERHNRELRIQLLNEADIVFLCLPDEAAKESVNLIHNEKTKVIDASTAHRTDSSWTYGFPELDEELRTSIQKATRVSNPGCHATAAIAAIYPLVKEGILNPKSPLCLTSITGYSGGGKQMIEAYQTSEKPAYKAPRQYALNLAHKHLPEIVCRAGLEKNPIFMPFVSNFERGLALTVPLYLDDLQKKVSKEDLYQLYRKYFGKSNFVKVHQPDDKESLVDGGVDVQASNDTNNLDLFIYGNDEQVQIIARLDNLGKGASGAAIQNMNIMLGLNETTGL